jgi:SsrA-binding protein
MAKPKKKESATERKVVARNRRARHDYEFLETLEAGLVLRGSEVKTLREGRGSIAEAYARIERSEAWLVGAHIPEYEQATYNNHTTRRRRKLLLNRREIAKWEKKVTQQGLTLVPVEIYFGERGYAKITLALARGKKEHDKRETIKKRDSDREMRRFKR